MSTAAWEFEHSVECDANRSFVWEFWTDASNWERIEGEAVESIKLEGPFEVGVQGSTKSPGQEPRIWRISQIDFERSATMEMPIDSAMFRNRITLYSLPDDRTRITQRLSIEGPIPQNILEGMRTFESTAPNGLAKLASAITARGTTLMRAINVIYIPEYHGSRDQQVFTRARVSNTA